MKDEIEENLRTCDEILNMFAKLSDSDVNEANTWLAIEQLENKTIDLKLMYKQQIPPENPKK